MMYWIGSSQIDDEVAADIDNIECEITGLLQADDGDKFASYIKSQLEDKDNDGNSKLCLSNLLLRICHHGAVKCAAALVRGATGMIVDLNIPLQDGMFPLHLAAYALSYELTELFIKNGAQANLRCNDVGQFSGLLPLNVAIETLCNSIVWTPKQSVYKLIVPLWEWKLKKSLDTVRLIAKKTPDLKEVCFHYAGEGKLVELAVLLMVAWEVVFDNRKEHKLGYHRDGTMTLGRYVATEIASLTDKENREIGSGNHELALMYKKRKKLLMAMMQLLEVYKRQGDIMELNMRGLGYDTFGKDSLPKQIAGLLRCGLRDSPLTKEDANYLEAMNWFDISPTLTRKVTVNGRKSIHRQANNFLPANLQSDGLPNRKLNDRQRSIMTSSLVGKRGFSSVAQSFHLFQSSKAHFDSDLCTTLEAQVKKPTKEIGPHLPNLLLSKNWPSFALALKRGIARI